MPALRELTEYPQRFRERLAGLVRPVLRGERLEDVGDAHDPGLHRHLLAGQPPRIALSVHALVVAAGVLRNVAEVLRPGQRLEHLDRGHDVVIDDFALLRVERAPRDAEVLDFILRQEVHARSRRVGPAVRGRDLAHARLRLRRHPFPACIAAAQELAVLVQASQALPQPFADQAFALGPGGVQRRVVAQSQPLPQRIDLGVALEHFEPRIDQADAVEYGLELGGLVDHVHRRGDLAAVVQHAGDPELVAVLVAHRERRQRSVFRVVGGFREHHRELGHALAMAPRVGRLLVDRGVDELDERFEQLLELVDERPVGKRYGRLRRERLREAPVGLREHGDLAGLRHHAVDELQHADDLALVVLHRHREEGPRPVARPPVELPRAGEVEPGFGVGVGDVDGALVDRRVRRHHRIVRLAVLVQLDRIEGNRVARCPAEGDAQRPVPHDREAQLRALLDQVERPAVGARDRLRRDQDVLQQAVEVSFPGKGGADPVELLQTPKQAVDGVHGLCSE